MSLNHAVGPDADITGEQAKVAAAMAGAGGRSASEYLRQLHVDGGTLREVVEIIPASKDGEHGLDQPRWPGGSYLPGEAGIQVKSIGFPGTGEAVAFVATDPEGRADGPLALSAEEAAQLGSPFNGLEEFDAAVFAAGMMGAGPDDVLEILGAGEDPIQEWRERMPTMGD